MTSTPAARLLLNSLQTKQYFVYILTNRSRTLYIGVTNNLYRRLAEHRAGIVAGFTKKYHLSQLIYFEATSDIEVAILREKQLKGWRRSKKIALIERTNPQWRDLSRDW